MAAYGARPLSEHRQVLGKAPYGSLLSATDYLEKQCRDLSSGVGGCFTRVGINTELVRNWESPQIIWK